MLRGWLGVRVVISAAAAAASPEDNVEGELQPRLGASRDDRAVRDVAEVCCDKTGFF